MSQHLGKSFLKASIVLLCFTLMLLNVVLLLFPNTQIFGIALGYQQTSTLILCSFCWLASFLCLILGLGILLISWIQTKFFKKEKKEKIEKFRFAFLQQTAFWLIVLCQLFYVFWFSLGYFSEDRAIEWGAFELRIFVFWIQFFSFCVYFSLSWYDFFRKKNNRKHFCVSTVLVFVALFLFHILFVNLDTKWHRNYIEKRTEARLNDCKKWNTCTIFSKEIRKDSDTNEYIVQVRLKYSNDAEIQTRTFIYSKKSIFHFWGWLN